MEHIFDDFLEDNYRYTIEGATLEEDKARLTLDVGLNFLLPFKAVKGAKEIIKEKIPGLAHVEFQFKYDLSSFDEEEIIKDYMEYLINMVPDQYSVFANTMRPESYQLTDGILAIYVIGEHGAKVLTEQIGPKFSNILQTKLGINRKVIFENHVEIYEKTKEDVAEAMKKPPIRQMAVSAKQPAKNYSQASGGRNFRSNSSKDQPMEITGDRLLGRPIKEEPIPMSQANEPGNKAVVEGEIFQVEEKTIKSGKKLIKFLFSDGTTSMCSKFFASEEKWEPLKKILKEGLPVIVAGDLEWDSYANALVLMAKSIEKGQIVHRKDNWEEKRVELHAHTKMSSMDGLASVKQLVGQAIEWGHEAIAITDHGVVQAFPEAAAVGGDKIKIIYGMEGYFFDDGDCLLEDGSIDYKKKKTYHIIILAKNQEGLKNLYKLVSKSHIDYFYKRPRIPKSVLDSHREGLILGGACEAGQVFQGVIGGLALEEMEAIAKYYDYLEIQPICNNQFMIAKGIAKDIDQLIEYNKTIVALGEKYNRPVVATCDAHYANKEDAIYRNILMSGQGYQDGGSQGLFFRTTGEMLDEFKYLPPEKAEEVVIHNPRMIADSIDNLKPVPKGKFPPKIDGADQILRDTCEENAIAKYGSPIPEKIAKRLDKELDSIIGNGYAVMYVSAKMLVDKSMADGFLVGSRGSVGSSFAATMSGITEVNPLAPHYICPQCKYLEWGDEMLYDCGVDMDRKNCPECGHSLDQEGFSIPFETFLGFEGDKEPDIDLNFAGEYQPIAHKYVDEIFGEKNVFKAGTIGTIASKTAYGFVKKYFQETGQPVNEYEIERLTAGCTGVRRTTGQHPGGIIIVPKDHDIHEFCPVQRPANDTKSDIITTHFDYHSIDSNLLKLDILGHDAPSQIRYLQDLTGLDPLKVPLKDQKVNSIFNGVEGLDIIEKDYPFTHGSYGIPEFGTRFVRQMLDDTKPDKFADLVRISGFSHGTNVWINNAQDYIRSGEATMREAISTRDDIMNYLILKGLANKDAFSIMEQVRKGRGVTPEQEEQMKLNGVPTWYIDSCKKISYMFPRAHAVAYVMMAYRIAYYKVYYPVEFYAVYLTTKIMDFNWDVIQQGSQGILSRIRAIEGVGNKATDKEQSELIVLEVVYEMYARGYEFSSPTLTQSAALKFTVKDGKVQIPFCALQGVGGTLGKVIEEAREERPFSTIEDFQTRTKANKTAIESLKTAGVLSGMPESDQISLF